MFEKIEIQKILNAKEKVILYITAFVIILSIVLNFAVVPIRHKNDSLNKEIYVNKAKLNKYLFLLNQKESMRNKYNKFFEHLGENAFNPDNSAGALSDLDNAAKKSNIRIIDMRSQGLTKTSALHKEIIIDLKTEGAMEGYFRFIYELESVPSLLTIKKFQLNAEPSGQSLEGIFSISQVSIAE